MAVGLSAVLAASRLGAERIVALSRDPARQAVAREFGATDVAAERGDVAIATVPGRVFDFETDLDHVVDAYNGMDERRAIKLLVRIAAS